MPLHAFMPFIRKLLVLPGAVALALAGCAAPPGDGQGRFELTAAQWELVKWPAHAMPAGGAHPVVLRFDQTGDTGRVSGHAGCNQFSAPYVLREADEITVATPVATRMACSPQVMEFEAQLLDKLESIASYRIAGNQLELTAADGHVLSFRARDKVGAEAVIKFIYVAPRQVACSNGAAPSMCYQVKEQQDDPWQVWHGGIAGFDYRPGTAYRLRILEERIARPPADAGKVKWTLDLVVEQEAAGGGK
jgi:heat shock protein HslJ